MLSPSRPVTGSPNDARPVRLVEHFANVWFYPRELLQRDLMDSTDFGEAIRLTSAYTLHALVKSIALV
jgi:hypothetical protein